MLAIRTLEAALREAADGPVKRTYAHRLALGWLARQKAGLDWHYAAFWRAMAETSSGGLSDGGKYSRTTQMYMLLSYWRRQLDIPEGPRI